MNFYPIYKNKKLLPWIKYWLIKGNKVMPKHISDWIDSASAITLTGVYKGSNLLNLNLKGNTSQTGTPTPEAPVPVNVVKGNNTIKINDTDYQVNLKSINLLNANTLRQGARFINTLTTTNRLFFDSNYFINQGETYTISTNIDTDIYRYAININDKPFPMPSNDNLEYDSGWKRQASFTFTAAVSGYLGVPISRTNDGDLTPSDVASYYFQIEKGSTSTTYEPYYDYELCKIGDYQDVIYKENNKWYVDKYVGKVVLNGSEPSWSVYLDMPVNPDYMYAYSSTYDSYLKGDEYNGFCDNFVNFGNYLTISRVIQQPCFSNSNNQNTTLRFMIPKTIASTRAEWVSWLSNNNVTVYGVLSTSTTSEITEPNLVAQLEAIYNAKLQSGTNTITQTPEDLPFYLNFQYYEKG